MTKEVIHLFELGADHYGLAISPMLASFVPVEDAVTAVDPHRHDSYGLFLLRSGAMTLLVEEQYGGLVAAAGAAWASSSVCGLK